MRGQGLDLQLRETTTYAGPRATAERGQRVGVPLVFLARRREAIRIEDLRVLEDVWQPVTPREREAYPRSCRHPVAGELELLDHAPRHVDHG